MESYNIDLPPIPYLTQILKNCPKSGLVYLDLWKMRNKENVIMVEKRLVRQLFVTSLVRFRNDVTGIVREGLANVDETPSHFIIEMVGWDEIDGNDFLG